MRKKYKTDKSIGVQEKKGKLAVNVRQLLYFSGIR